MEASISRTLAKGVVAVVAADDRVIVTWTAAAGIRLGAAGASIVGEATSTEAAIDLRSACGTTLLAVVLFIYVNNNENNKHI